MLSSTLWAGWWLAAGLLLASTALTKMATHIDAERREEVMRTAQSHASLSLCLQEDLVGKFHCGNFYCIDESLLCDGRKDCPSGLDELLSTCKNVICPGDHSFPCGDGRCLRLNQTCDGVDDCVDGRDENATYCEFRRPRSEPQSSPCPSVTCAGQCVFDEEELCNGKDYHLCKEGEDEARDFCEMRTRYGSCLNGKLFFCGNGQCVQRSQVCDGYADCETRRDEDPDVCSDYKTQQLCADHEWKCASTGSCINLTHLCDGWPHCQYAEDESSAVCGTNRTCPLSTPQLDYVICPGNGSCVERSKACGFSKDAPLGCFNDEVQRLEFCQATLNQRSCAARESSNIEMFQCGDGQCIQLSQVCDGWSNCLNDADEMRNLCTDDFTCMAGQFKCRDLTWRTVCLHEDVVCDGKVDCPNGADEDADMCASRQCTDYYFSCGDGQCIPYTYLADDKVHCTNGADETNDTYARRWGYEDKDKSCPTSDYFSCRDYKASCIRSDLVCRHDRTAACDNRADQNPEVCQADRECPGGQVSCGDGQCVHAYQMCDGVRVHCANGRDEDSAVCEAYRAQRPDCPSDQYQCQESGQCVPTRYVCDGATYCLADNDDESEAACAWRNVATSRVAGASLIIITTQLLLSSQWANRMTRLGCI